MSEFSELLAQGCAEMVAMTPASAVLSVVTSTGYSDATGQVEPVTAGWDDSFPIQRANVQFKEPAKALWGRLSIRTGRTIEASAGVDGFDRVPGIVTLQIFAPAGTGLGLAEAGIDSLKAIFDRQ